MGVCTKGELYQNYEALVSSQTEKARAPKAQIRHVLQNLVLEELETLIINRHHRTSIESRAAPGRRSGGSGSSGAPAAPEKKISKSSKSEGSAIAPETERTPKGDSSKATRAAKNWRTAKTLVMSVVAFKMASSSSQQLAVPSEDAAADVDSSSSSSNENRSRRFDAAENSPFQFGPRRRSAPTQTLRSCGNSATVLVA